MSIAFRIFTEHYPGRQQSYARYESYKDDHNEILFMVYTRYARYSYY